MKARERINTTEYWVRTNKVLGTGEMGIEKLTDGAERAKLGDGKSHWNELPYLDLDPCDVVSVNGRHGEVILSFDDIPGLQSSLDNKQYKLESAVNIKTINGVSILGSGNIDPTDKTKLPLYGGVMTGPIISLKEKVVLMDTNEIDLNQGNLFVKTITGPTAFSIKNPPSVDVVCSIVMELTNAGSSSINWFSNITWADGMPPVLTVNGVDILAFYTRNAGATWRGFVLSLDTK